MSYILKYLQKPEDKIEEPIQSPILVEKAKKFEEPAVETQTESFPKFLAEKARNYARGAARATETVLGLPKAAADLAGAVSIPAKKSLIKSAENLGIDKPIKKAISLQEKFSPSNLLPSSEDIRENVTKYLFGEKLEPRTASEAKVDELVSDFSALAFPMPGSQLKVMKPLMLALGGNAVKEGADLLGFKESTQNLAKIGTFFLGSMVKPGGAEVLKNNLFGEAAKNRPIDATVSYTSLENTINTLEREMMKGGVAGSDMAALKAIADIRKEAQGAQIPIDSLERLKVKINEAKAGIFKQLEGNKPGIKSAKRNLDQVSRAVDDALKLYGKSNPVWEQFYRPANEIHGAIQQSKKVRNLIKRYYKSATASGTLALFGLEQAVGAWGVAGAAAGGGAALLTGELLSRVIKSPTLRKYYLNVLKEGSKENVPAMLENLKKMDSILLRDQKESEIE